MTIELAAEQRKAAVASIERDFHEDEFQYWRKFDRERRKK